MAKFTPGEIAILWHPGVGEVSGIDWSSLHGTEVEVIGICEPMFQIMGYDYDIKIPGIDEVIAASEKELRKKYDGDEPTEWEDCAWNPTMVPEETH